MTHVQTVVETLFDRFPPQELGGGPERDQFERLRASLSDSQGWMGTLQRLYQAEQCDELALGLMWITERLEADPDRREPGADEEDVFFRALRKGLGLPQASFGDVTEPSAFFSVDAPTQSESFEEVAAPPAESSFEPPMQEITPEPSVPAGGGAEVEGTSDPDIFGRLLERFLEAVQSGSDDRAEILERLRASCAVIRSDPSSGEEYKRYAELVEDFLGYINEHQLLDDVRVMNLVTNIQEPFGQWLSTPENERSGILDQGFDMHKDFRTMFE